MEYDSDEEHANRVFEAFQRDYLPAESSHTGGAAGVEESESFYPDRSFFRGNISSIPPVDESANVLRSFNASGYAGVDDDYRSNAHASFSYGDAAGAGEYEEYYGGAEG